jgi:hypothetical protein
LESELARGVQDDGAEDEDGFACEGEAHSKYYAADVLNEDMGCVAIYYDGEKKLHSLE